MKRTLQRDGIVTLSPTIPIHWKELEMDTRSQTDNWADDTLKIGRKKTMIIQLLLRTS